MVKAGVDTYANRLRAAMAHGQVTEKKLWEALKVTRQAVTKVLSGASSELKAVHNARAARLCGVSSDWLATGEGPMVPSPAWPFPLVDRARYDSLDPEMRGYVQKAMNSALDECNGAAKNASPFAERRGRGNRLISSPWSETHHPARRADDKKEGY